MCKPPVVFFYTLILVFVFPSITNYADSHLSVETNKKGELTVPGSGDITNSLNRGGGVKVVAQLNQDGKLISPEKVVPENDEENISTTNWKTGETVTITRFQDGLMAIVKTDRCGRVISRRPWHCGDSNELHEYVDKLLNSGNAEKWPAECDSTEPVIGVTEHKQ